MRCENYMKFKFHCPQIRFYWNRATLTCSQIVFDCFYATVAVLSSDCNQTAKPKIFTIWPFTKKYADLWPSVNYTNKEPGTRA